MEISFWDSKWEKGHIGFHMENGYEPLQKFWEKLGLPDKAAVLVPFCGKSVDLVWLAGNGANVKGVEIIEKTVKEFFKEQQLTPNITENGDFNIYKTGPIEIWQGDFFKLNKSKLDSVDVVYDKGGLVAIPEKLQENYVKKLFELSDPGTKILLHHFQYPQEEMDGPPFSVPLDRIKKLYGEHYTIRTLLQETTNRKYEKFEERGLKSPLLERFLYLEPK